MKILITGGSGFLGRNLVERLAAEGHGLSCLDRYMAPFLEEFGVKTYQGDVYEKRLVDEAVAGVDAIVHMACTVIPKTSNDDPHFDVMSNVGGTIHLLDAAVANRISKFVFISSGGTVYGTPMEVPIREAHPTNPDCSYGITKLAIEKYLGLYRKLHGLNSCSLRLANPYGVHQRFHAAQGVIPVSCYKALCGEPVEIWGDGSVRRDFVYVSDAVEAIVRTLGTPEAVGEINIGGGASTSLNEMLDVVDAIVGRKTRRIYLPSRDFDVQENYLCIEKASELIGWSPRIDLRQGIGLTLDYIRSALPLTKEM